jgi:putative flavoprotein involved in K+ transport
VLWCTGSGPDFSFLDVPGAFDAHGHAVHRRGLSPVDGLGFLGLDFQYSAASSTIQGLTQDARYLRRHLTHARAQAEAATPARSLA